MHVPKSGGMSVVQALERAAPPGSVCPKTIDGWTIDEWFDVAGAPASVRDRIAATDADIRMMQTYGFVVGHFALPVLERVAPASEIVTVLRGPRSRLLSLYRYWRRQYAQHVANWGDAGPHRHALRALPDFLGDPSLARWTDNVVARFAMHGDPRVRDGAFVDPADVEALSEAAIERLERLRHVAILESGDLFEELSQALGVRLRPLRVNVTDGSRAVPEGAAPADPDHPDVPRLLDERTRVDRLVYAHFARDCGPAPASEPGSQGRAQKTDEFPDADVFDQDTELVMARRELATMTAWALRLQGDVAHMEARIERMRVEASRAVGSAAGRRRSP